MVTKLQPEMETCQSGIHLEGYWLLVPPWWLGPLGRTQLFSSLMRTFQRNLSLSGCPMAIGKSSWTASSFFLVMLPLVRNLGAYTLKKILLIWIHRMSFGQKSLIFPMKLSVIVDTRTGYWRVGWSKADSLISAITGTLLFTPSKYVN